MRKLLLVFVLLMVLLVGCSSEDEILNMQSASQVSELLEDNANVVVVIGQTTCGACIQYKPVLEELLTNYEFDLVYVELDKDNSDDLKALVDDYLIEANATPTTYVFVEGERVDMYVGYMDYRTTKAFFQSNGVIE